MKNVHFFPVKIDFFYEIERSFSLELEIFLRNLKLFSLHRAGKIPFISVYLKDGMGEEEGEDISERSKWW